MLTDFFPVIDLTATGNNIKRLRVERGLSVRDLQEYFGFEEPRAIYKWQNGQCLPTVDNLYALGHILKVPVDEILIPTTEKLYNLIGVVSKQQLSLLRGSACFNLPEMLKTKSKNMQIEAKMWKNIRRVPRIWRRSRMPFSVQL